MEDHRYAVCLTIPIGYGPETGRTILRRESYRRLGKEIKNGWDIVNFWVRKVQNGCKISINDQEYDRFQLRAFLGLFIVDLIMISSITVAISLGGLTFYYIKKADKISAQGHNLQWKLFIAVCAQVRKNSFKYFFTTY